MTLEEKIESQYKRDEIFKNKVQPQMVDFTSRLKGNTEKESDLIDYMRSIISEAHSYPNMVSMLEMMNDVFNENVSRFSSVYNTLAEAHACKTFFK